MKGLLQPAGSPNFCLQIPGSETSFPTYAIPLPSHRRPDIESRRTKYSQFRQLPKESLPVGIDHATAFTSVCINTAIYLPWLVSRCLQNGVKFKRATVAHIADAASLGIEAKDRVHVVVNCTGLLASTLGGVEDDTVIPARGQIVVVRNTSDGMCDISGTDDGDNEACYIMTRAAGGGTILGGSYQLGNSDPQIDQDLALRIMKRAIALDPSLTEGKGIEHLDIIRHGVGLRPIRRNGTRIEKENIRGIWVVHNYGAGGAGYQSSYGCSAEAVELVDGLIGPSSHL
jgi:D-amino-acid oxidase